MSLDIGDEIRSAFPDTDETIIDYVSGYVEYAVEDDTGEDVVAVVRELLESFARGHESALDALLAKLENYLEEVMKIKPKSKGPKLTRLDRVLDMSKTAMSNTITLTEGVDLESVNKSKCVLATSSLPLDFIIISRASQVDLKKLEKQEAKLRAKIDKRTTKGLYEGSKLIAAQQKQVCIPEETTDP